MTSREQNRPRISLQARRGEVPMTMDMQQFFELSFFIAEELLDLEAQYCDWMTAESVKKPILANRCPDHSWS